VVISSDCQRDMHRPLHRNSPVFDPNIVEKIGPMGVYCIERNITIFLISRFTIQIRLSSKGLCHEMNIFLKAYTIK